MNLVILGRTGSGKTSVSRLVAKQYGLRHIASGDIARSLATEDPHTAVALERGLPAPEEAMRAAVRDEIERAEIESGGWVLDGFPRMLEQLVCLMAWCAAPPNFALLDVPEFTCIERLLSRERPDDSPDAIARRLVSFREKTQPVVACLDEARVLCWIHSAHEKSIDYLVSEIGETLL